MNARTTPPFRADHVGSFLRPKFLLDARDRKAKGEISADQLRAVEDKAIAEIVRFQEDVGLQSITDGEFRRTYFHIDFLDQLGGVKTDIPVTITKPDGTQELAPPVMRVTGKVRHAKDIQRADFEYLKSQLSPGHTPKVTIPSPTMLHFRGGRAGISREAYPELEPDFYDDVAAAYGDELRSLAAAGCTYVQMDDTNMAYLCDEKMREAARARGDDPNELPHRYAKFINKVVAHKPAGMTLAMYMNNRAAESLARGRIDDAYWWAREAIVQEPGFVRALNTLGVVYRRHGDLAQAERALRQAYSAQPANPQIVFNLAQVLAEQGRGAEAQSLRDRLAQLQPEAPFSYFDRGRIALKNGDAKAARDLFLREVDRAPYNAEFHYWLAVAYAKLGDVPAARAQLELAMEASATRSDRDLYAAKLERFRAHATQ